MIQYIQWRLQLLTNRTCGISRNGSVTNGSNRVYSKQQTNGSAKYWQRL